MNKVHTDNGDNEDRISDEMQKKIIKKLEERGAVNPCPKCGGRDFYLSDGYDVISTQKRLDGIVLFGRYLPCALIVCKNCGNVSFHAIGALGLIEDAEKDWNHGKE